MTKTIANLRAAFAGESQANQKYLAFADQANKEDLPSIARLFRAVAKAETVHAHAHLRAMDGIGKTANNLRDAIAGELHEFNNMYPDMIATAKKEGHKTAERSFTIANEVERVHAALYEKALANLDTQTEFRYIICSVCGYTSEDHALDKCPVCSAPSNAFLRVD
ncbi:Rubrerythrin family protein [Desulfovibrionales bacterium]